MRLNPPKKITFWIAIILGALGIIGAILGLALGAAWLGFAWILIALGLILLVLGLLIKGL